MRQLSAADALAPAWRHTASLLWKPFRWRTSLKITVVAFFAGIAGFNLNVSSNNFSHHNGVAVLPRMEAVMMAWMVTFFVIGLAIGLVIMYVGSRLQFVLLEVVLRRDTWISPIWQRYGAKTWRWIGLKLLLFVAMLLCLLPVMLPLIIRLAHMQPQGTIAPDRLVSFFMAMLGMIGVVLLFVLVFTVIYALLSDFGLPSMALENTTIRETVARIVRLYRAEPGQVTLYVFLRVLLQVAGAFLAEMAVVLVCLIALIPLGGAGLGLWMIFRHEGLAGHALMIGGAVVLGVILLALALLVFVVMLGWTTTFVQAYALYFLGGRYPLVGQYLEPLLPPPFVPYPVAGAQAVPESGNAG